MATLSKRSERSGRGIFVEDTAEGSYGDFFVEQGSRRTSNRFARSPRQESGTIRSGKQKCFVPLSAVFFATLGWTAFLWNAVSQFNSTGIQTHPRKMKYILYYTKYWGENDFGFGEGQSPFIKTGCPITDCYVTANQSLLPRMSQFDAFLYHAHMDSIGIDDYLWAKKHRTPQQRHILMALESQVYTNRRIPYRVDRQQFPHLDDTRDVFGNEQTTDPYDNYFHWMMSFRWDSDIPRPYGWFQDKSSPTFLPSLPDKWIAYDEQAFLTSLPSRPDSFRQLARRPKKVAWIVSDCVVPSNRDKYVDELSKYIQVDIFGACGFLPCNGTYNTDHGNKILDSCSASVQNEYKFYLSFENAFCRDYVTEKFFGRVEHNVVVVMGQANYTRIAPPHSHLNVLDFASPKELANKLLALDQNDDQYLSYFWWRDFYQVSPSHFSPQQRSLEFARSFCHLCEKLHQDDDNNGVSKTYENLQDWWRGPSECNQMDWGGVDKEMRLDWNL